MSFFQSVEKAPDDPILGLTAKFKGDPRPNKVNLCVGAYKNSVGKSFILSSVRDAEKTIIEQQLSKDYLPIPGDAEYINLSLELLYGRESTALAEKRIFGAQSIGGTGALRIGGELLYRNQISQTVYLSDPTWPNHTGILSRAGMNLKTYTYYDHATHTLDYHGLCDSIKKIPQGSTILLQPCCHNPTGLTPTFEQWKELSTLIKQQKLLPFFDIAYQGFGQGIEEDAQVIRTFVDHGHEMLVASSFSKNFGLYGERAGHLSVVCANKDDSTRVGSQLKQVIRAGYSMPPLQGERIVKTILSDATLYSKWIVEVAEMRARIHEMRQALAKQLIEKGGDRFTFLLNQEGMFSFSGLNKQQIKALEDDDAIYMLSNGRINIAALTYDNLDYVTSAILRVIKS